MKPTQKRDAGVATASPHVRKLRAADAEKQTAKRKVLFAELSQRGKPAAAQMRTLTRLLDGPIVKFGKRAKINVVNLAPRLVPFLEPIKRGVRTNLRRADAFFADVRDQNRINRQKSDF